MAVMRRGGSIVGRVLVIGLFAVLASWVVWTWPWAPLAWLAILMVVAGAVALRRHNA